MYTNDSQNQSLVTSIDSFVTDDTVLTNIFVTIVVVGQIVTVIGIITNIINMIIFLKIGFEDSINICLFSMAFSDFWATFTSSLSFLGKNPWLAKADLPFVPTEVEYMILAIPVLVFNRITVDTTAFIAFGRCLCVLMPLKVKNLLTRSRVSTVIVLIYTINLLILIPNFFTGRLQLKFYPEMNRSLIGLVPSKNGPEIEAGVFVYNAMMIPLAFVFITISTGILALSLRKKSDWRQTATTGTASDSTSSKEKRVAKMVVVIASLFIICYTPVSVILLMTMTDDSLSPIGPSAKLFLVLVSFVLNFGAFNSSVNIFIYYRFSSNFRNVFDSVFGLRRTEKDTKSKE